MAEEGDWWAASSPHQTAAAAKEMPTTASRKEAEAQSITWICLLAQGTLPLSPLHLDLVGMEEDSSQSTLADYIRKIARLVHGIP